MRQRQADLPAIGITPGLTPSAYDLGRNGELLPDIHVFSKLTELDTAYAEEMGRRRAQLETLARDIAELAERLAAPLPEDGVTVAKPKRRFAWRRHEIRAGEAEA